MIWLGKIRSTDSVRNGGAAHSTSRLYYASSNTRLHRKASPLTYTHTCTSPAHTHTHSAYSLRPCGNKRGNEDASSTQLHPVSNVKHQDVTLARLVNETTQPLNYTIIRREERINMPRAIHYAKAQPEPRTRKYY